MKFLRSFSLMLAMAFFMGAVAPAGAEASVLATYDMEATEHVATAFDKFNYTMNVEWDQHDPLFKTNAEKELATSLNDVSSDLLVSYTANSFTDSKTREDFFRMVEAIKVQKLTQEEAAAVAQDWASNSSVGLNFSGGHGHHCSRMCKITIICLIVFVVKTIYEPTRGM